MSKGISVRVPREAKKKELVDSSAYARYFAKRAGSVSAGNHMIQPAIIVLAFAEVTDALTKKTALGETNKEDAESPLRKMVETRGLVGQNSMHQSGFENVHREARYRL